VSADSYDLLRILSAWWPSRARRFAAPPCLGYLESPAGRRVASDGLLTLSGWLFSRGSSIDRVWAVTFGSHELDVSFGRPRPDVASANPGEPRALCSGFVATVPLERGGRVDVELWAQLSSGQRVRCFALTLAVDLTPPPVRPEVYVVLLAFGERNTRRALERAELVARRSFPSALLHRVVVDNLIAGHEETRLAPGVFRISGDNAWREFSGWDRGITWLEQRDQPSPGAILVLANDTLARDDKWRKLDAMGAPRVASACAAGALVGYVDAYPRPVELFGLRTRQWVDTTLVMARFATLSRLRPLALPFDDSEIFAADWRQVFREPSPLSENYRAYLRAFLFGEPSPEAIEAVWHARAALTADNWPDFRGKIRSLLCEHHLSARARAARIPLADVRPDGLAIDP
jgi:hypothetical protein